MIWDNWIETTELKELGWNKWIETIQQELNWKNWNNWMGTTECEQLNGNNWIERIELKEFNRLITLHCLIFVSEIPVDVNQANPGSSSSTLQAAGSSRQSSQTRPKPSPRVANL